MTLLERSLLFLSLILLGTAQYFIFLVVPSEVIMGAVQRLFYFHVASALACYLAFGIVFLASLLYLTTRDPKADRISWAAGEVGFVFCTITLITGMIWGRTAWNTWFSWSEPRLVTFLVLWLIFLTFTVLRNVGDRAKVSAHSSIIGILGAVSVPIVYVSVRLLPETARLHPVVTEKNGLRHWSYWVAFGISVFGMMLFMLFLTLFRARVAKLDEEVALATLLSEDISV